ARRKCFDGNGVPANNFERKGETFSPQEHRQKSPAAPVSACHSSGSERFATFLVSCPLRKPTHRKLPAHENSARPYPSVSTPSKTVAPPILQHGRNSLATSRQDQILLPGTSSVSPVPQSRPFSPAPEPPAASTRSSGPVFLRARCRDQSRSRWGSLRILCSGGDSTNRVAKRLRPRRGPKAGPFVRSARRPERP